MYEKREKTVFGFLIGIIFLTTMFNLVGASFSLGSPAYSIEKSYGSGENVRGWIDLKLENEDAELLFSSSTGTSFPLIEVVKKVAGIKYSCNPADCKKSYTLSEKSLKQSFTIGENSSVIVGINLTGNVSSIISFNISMNSDALEGCRNQLEINFFDDGTNEMKNNKYSSSVCSGTKDYGCFKLTTPYVEAKLGPTPYCEKVTLKPAPAHEIGMRLKRIGSIKQVSVKFYNLSGSERAKCDLAEKVAPSDGEESCVIEYPTEKEETGYACVYSTEGETEYSIRGYQTNNGCGFRAIPDGKNQNVAAYSIFSQALKYDKVGSLVLPDEWTLGGHYIDFLKSKYKNTDCTLGCIIPIKIKSNQAQKVEVGDLKIDFETVLFGQQNERFLYKAGDSKIVLNTDGIQRIYLDNLGISVPKELGQQNFKIYLGSQKIIDESLEIKDVPTPESIEPMNTAAALPTEFSVFISANGNISYEWDFGDGHKETTIIPKITHTYLQTGIFQMIVSAMNNEGLKGVKTFSIMVESPYNAINSTLNKKVLMIVDLKKQISTSFPSFEQTSINEFLKLSEAEDELKQIQETYLKTNPASNSTIIELMKTLIEVKIPDKIVITKRTDAVQFYSPEESIKYDVLKRVYDSATDYDGSNFENKVNAWNKNNLDTKITFREISGKYGNNFEPIIKTFELDMTKKREMNYTPILFLPNLYDLKFSGRVENENSSDYLFIPLKKNSEKIIFSTTDEVDFKTLEAFISPSVDYLGVQTNVKNENSMTILWILIGILGFFVVAMFTYIIIKLILRREKESHLFKNRNEVYNIITFIENEKRKGRNEKEIENGLKRAGWSSKQISYMLKTYAGNMKKD